MNKKILLLLFNIFFICQIHAQAPDCVDANNICPSQPQTYTPTPGSYNDYSDSDNDPGCLLSDEQESMWFTLSFDNTMPPNSNIEVIIEPNSNDDYDFAFYGPDVDCDNLGSPIRCSYAAGPGNTGLQDGAGDLTEGALGNRYVEDLIVQPGETYTLIVSNFSESGDGFEFSFGGSAVPYLDCPCDLMLTAGPDVMVCEGASPFSISASISGNTGSETYSWSATNGGLAYLSNPNIINPNVNLPNNFSGNITYTLTVTDALCTENIDVQVSTFPPPTPNGGSVSICDGESTSLNAGNGYASYSWSSGASSNPISVSSPGVYTVTVTDNNGCEGTATFDVQQAPTPSVTISGSLTICAGGTTELFASPGYSTYQWSTSESSNSITVSSPGTYSVTITDANGCTNNTEVTVVESNIGTITVNASPLIICPNGTSILDAGPGFATYQWSGGNSPNNQQTEVASPGTYTVTVTDPGGCQSIGSVTVTAGTPPSPSITGATAICGGQSTTLNASPGFDTYQWSGGSTPNNQQNTISSPGTYSLTVTDANGCEGTTSITITELPPLSVSISGDLAICSNGQTTLDAGAGYSSYQWSGGNTPSNQQNTITSAGTYSVTVTDANGCEGSASVTITTLPPLSPSISGDLNICPNGQGQTTLSANSGYTSYQWSGGNNPTNQQNTITSPGTYSLTVTDANGCEGSTSVTITELPAPMPSISGDLAICPNGQGQTTLSANNGYSSYQWSGGNNPSNQQNTITSPGTYSLTVTDANGCEGNTSISVTELPPLSPTISGNLTICPNGEGQTTLSVDGNYASYQWSGGNNPFNQQNTVTSAGTYSVTVTDNNGCEGSTSVSITELPAPAPTIFGNLSICDGEQTILDGGSGYINYQWSGGNNPNSAQNTITSAGTYGLTVTDANGCTGSTTATVNELPAPTPTISGNFTVCPGIPTLVSVDQNYAAYEWSGGNNTNTQINSIAAAGSYTVTVTDFSGCQATAEVTISPSQIDPPEIIGEPTICSGESTDLIVLGDYASYQWSGGQHPNASINTISAPGDYSLTVTNYLGCSSETTITVNETLISPPIINGNALICEGESTILSVNDIYTDYQWSNDPSLNSATNTVSESGIYAVTITASNGCQASADIFISVLDLPPPIITGDLTMCEGESTSLSIVNPTNYDQIIWSTTETSDVITVNQAQNITVEVSNSNGCTSSATAAITTTPNPVLQIMGATTACDGETITLASDMPYTTYSWSNNSSNSTLEVNESGLYQLTVTNQNGCQGSDAIDITIFDNPTVEITGSTSFCIGGATTIASNANFNLYNWSNGETSSSINVTQSGNYQLTVTDENGCQAIDDITITEQTELNPIIAGPSSFCTGSEITLDAGSDFATYSWSDNTNNNTISVDQGGDYSVTVTDIYGCSGETTVSIIENQLPIVTISGETSFCTNDSTIIDAGNYNAYSWSNTSTSASTTIYTPGNYEVTVTDENGCQGIGDISITENQLPSPSINGNHLFCPNTTTDIAVDGNYADYQWSTNESTDQITINSIGEYGVTVVDENGCLGSTSIAMDEYLTNIPVIQGNDFICPEGNTTLSTTANFSTYNWSTSSVAPTLDINTAGTYGLTVTDANGCQTNNLFEVAEYTVTPPTIQGVNGFCSNDSAVLSIAENFATYQWSTTENNNAITVTEGGNYAVTVTDQNNCSTDGTFFITEHPLPNVNIAGSYSYCIGNSTTLSAGDTYASYNWSTSSTASSIEVSTPGSITLDVIDENGCPGSTTIDVTEDTELSPVIAGNPEFCIGTTTTIDAGGGYASYQWSDNSQGQSLEISTAGIYTVTVTDASGCLGQGQIEVVERPLPTPTILGTLEFCEGQNTALDVDGNFSTYSWSSGENQPSITINVAGDYTVTVTNEFNCANTATTQVLSHTLPVFELEGQDFFCENDQTTISVNNNYPIYNWSNAASTQSIAIQQAGSFSVEVTDENGCQQTQSITIEEIPNPVANAGDNQFLDCDTHQLTIGSTPTTNNNWVYQWEGPGITATTANLPQPIVEEVGTYTLTIQDEVHNCVSEVSTVVIEDLSYDPSVVLQVHNTLDCLTDFVIVDGTSSTSGNDIIYQWYDENGQLLDIGSNMEYIANSPQIYILEVIDTITSCSAQDSIEVLEDTAYPIAIAGPDAHLDCSIIATNLNGDGSYEGSSIVYQWTTLQGGNIILGDTTLHPLVNQPGIYQIEVVDTNNGCSNMDTVTVTQDITLPTVEAGEDQTLDCLTESVTLNSSSSTPSNNFTYHWESLDSGEIVSTDWSFSTQTAGLYLLSITNQDNGCSNSDVVEVVLDDNYLLGFEANIQDESCFAQTDGAINIPAVEGGTPPFLYNFNNEGFTTNNNFSNLPPGDYEITIQDVIGCEWTETLSIQGGNDVQVNMGDDIFIDLGEHATIEAITNLDDDEIATVLLQSQDSIHCQNIDCLEFITAPMQTTNFNVTIVDENGCSDFQQITVFVNRPGEIYVPNAFSPNGDGNNDVFMIFSRNDVEKVHSFEIFNRWGEPIYEVYDFPTNEEIYGWDGTYKGQLFNSAVFVWSAKVEFIDGQIKIFSGDVTLMR